jgi:hypothetical protein
MLLGVCLINAGNGEGQSGEAPKMSTSKLVAVREEEDLQYEIYGNAAGMFVVRKSDRKTLALPWTPATWGLRKEIAKLKRGFIAGALTGFATNKKWKSPRALGLKETHGEDLYAT